MAVSVANLGLFRVHNGDGTTQEVRITSRAVVDAERKWPGRAEDGSDRYPFNEGLHFLVWVSLGRPARDFDAWLDSIQMVEPLEDKVDDPVPIKPAVGVA